MPMVFVESREEFEARHGKVSFPAMDQSGDMVFATGARRGPQGLMDPPTDPEHRKRAELYFWECRVEHQTALYRTFRNDLKETLELVKKGAAVLPPEPAELARLKKMSAEILKAKLERDKRLREMPEAQWKRDRQRAADERRSSVDPMIRALSELPQF